MDWRDDYVKLFMSHIAEHKALVGEVAEELIDHGIHGFVAHNDISPSRSWEDEIKEALQTCDAMAAFLHKGFKESHWTDQEVGFCLARDVKIIPLRFDLNPYGFMGRYQAAPSQGKTAREIGDLVLDALLDDSRTKRKAEDGIISSLKDSQQLMMEDPKYTLVTTTDTPPTASEVLTNGTESDLEREILITNPGTNGYLWIYAVQDINYIGFQPTGDNQFGGFRAGDDVVLNGTTYHVWRSNRLLLGSIFDLTWYAYES